MTYNTFKRMVKKWNGWIEGEVAYFPTPWHKAQFEREVCQ